MKCSNCGRSVGNGHGPGCDGGWIHVADDVAIPPPMLGAPTRIELDAVPGGPRRLKEPDDTFLNCLPPLAKHEQAGPGGGCLHCFMTGQEIAAQRSTTIDTISAAAKRFNDKNVSPSSVPASDVRVEVIVMTEAELARAMFDVHPDLMGEILARACESSQGKATKDARQSVRDTMWAGQKPAERARCESWAAAILARRTS